MPAEVTEGGDVVFLARAPGQVAPQRASSGVSINRGARSGNANFDPANGQFAKKGGKDPKGPAQVDVNPVSTTASGVPQGVTQEVWDKRLDTVREAARQYAALDVGDAQSFLKGRVQDLSAVDVNQFVTDVKHAQMDDLVDILDHQIRGRLSSKNGVRVQASKPWTKKVFSGLTDDEVTRVVTRLLNKGWKAAAIKKNVLKLITDEGRRARLEGALG